MLSVAIPLSLTCIAASLSPWFNLLNNALSDLGHAVRSDVAPIFNLGLVVGGLLVFTVGLRSSWISKIYNAVVMYSGFSLILVGVFDEVYGLLHFIVSVMFFIGLAAFLVVITICEDLPIKITSLTLLAISTASWYIHYTYNMPRGAAVPELISVASFTPTYLWKYSRNPQQNQQPY